MVATRLGLLLLARQAAGRGPEVLSVNTVMASLLHSCCWLFSTCQVSWRTTWAQRLQHQRDAAIRTWRHVHAAAQQDTWTSRQRDLQEWLRWGSWGRCPSCGLFYQRKMLEAEVSPLKVRTGFLLLLCFCQVDRVDLLGDNGRQTCPAALERGTTPEHLRRSLGALLEPLMETPHLYPTRALCGRGGSVSKFRGEGG